MTSTGEHEALDTAFSNIGVADRCLECARNWLKRVEHMGVASDVLNDLNDLIDGSERTRGVHELYEQMAGYMAENYEWEDIEDKEKRIVWDGTAMVHVESYYDSLMRFIRDNQGDALRSALDAYLFGPNSPDFDTMENIVCELKDSTNRVVGYKFTFLNWTTYTNLNVEVRYSFNSDGGIKGHYTEAYFEFYGLNYCGEFEGYLRKNIGERCFDPSKENPGIEIEKLLGEVCINHLKAQEEKE